MHDLPNFVYFNHSIHVSKGSAAVNAMAASLNAADLEECKPGDAVVFELSSRSGHLRRRSEFSTWPGKQMSTRKRPGQNLFRRIKLKCRVWITARFATVKEMAQEHDLEALRFRRASLRGKQYWRSLDELADTPRVQCNSSTGISEQCR